MVGCKYHQPEFWQYIEQSSIVEKFIFIYEKPLSAEGFVFLVCTLL
jgi:hypothetical protein